MNFSLPLLCMALSGAPDWCATRWCATRCYWSFVFAGARRTPLVLVTTLSLLAACFTRRKCVRNPFAGRLIVLTVLLVFSAMLVLLFNIT